MKEKKYKIKKLKSSNRIKIIDRPEILVVYPKTIDASIRYGHKSRWCTSTQAHKRFYRHQKVGVLLYILIYNVINGKRDGDAKTKIALYKRFTKKAQWVCYDFSDNNFDYDALKWILDEKYDLTNIIEKFYQSFKNELIKKKILPVENKEGEIIKGVGSELIIIEPFGNWKYRNRRRWRYGRRRCRRKYKKRTPKNLQQYIKFEIYSSDILKAKIIEAKQKVIIIKIIEMNIRTPFIEYIFKNYKLIASLNISNKKQTFIVIKKK